MPRYIPQVILRELPTLLTCLCKFSNTGINTAILSADDEYAPDPYTHLHPFGYFWGFLLTLCRLYCSPCLLLYLNQNFTNVPCYSLVDGFGPKLVSSAKLNSPSRLTPVHIWRNTKNIWRTPSVMTRLFFFFCVELFYTGFEARCPASRTKTKSLKMTLVMWYRYLTGQKLFKWDHLMHLDIAPSNVQKKTRGQRI